MKKILIATRNKGKLKEMADKLKDLNIQFLSLDDIRSIPPEYEPEETGKDLEENAIIKAKAYGEKSKILTLADDTGLEVDALGGRPGVYSARYASGSDEDRYRKLLSEMQNISENQRTACFKCVMAIYNPSNKTVKICKGACEGKIAKEPVGDNGFGYDPVFYIPQIKKTFAQLTKEEKSKISHRGKALEKVEKILRD